MIATPEALFQPFGLGTLSLANRIVMAPMTRGFSPDGVPGPDVADYYRRRAEGGVGLIITEGVGVDHPAALGGSGVDGDNVPHMHGPKALAGWRNVVDEVHRAGGVIIPQLWHQGAMRETGTGPCPDTVSVSPSGIWGPAGRQATISQEQIDTLAVPSQVMTEEIIADVIAGFARSARNAMAVGFDGIAIHGAHGYLVDNFLWDQTNLRRDRWGGDRGGRAAFARELVKAIRAEIGEGPPIIFRFSQWKQQDARARLGETPSELEEVLGPISDAGVDMFDGSQRYFDRPEYDGSSLNLAGWAKKITGKPSMTVGGVGITQGRFDTAEAKAAALSANIAAVSARLERGEFDLVGVGRSLLHDAGWTNKLRLGTSLPDYDDTSRLVLT